MNPCSTLENEGDIFEFNQKIKALAHPNRIKIIFVLAKKELTVYEISKRTKLTQSNTSQQLSILYTANLVTRNKIKNSVYYSIKDLRVLDLFNYLINFKN